MPFKPKSLFRLLIPVHNEEKQFFFIAVFVLFTFFSSNAQLKNNSADNLIVKIEAGKVRGKFIKGIAIFKNIHYAAAPVGDLRFAAPIKPAP